MPAVLALPAFWGAVSAGAAVSGGLIAGRMQSNASRDAANAQIQSTREAQAATTAASDKTLAFTERQAAADAQRFEQTQHANYNQWASREGRMSDFGQALGLGARNIPQYQSSMPGGAPSGGATGGADPKISAFIADWQKSHAPTEGIAPLADAITKQFPNVGRYMYGQTASNNELNIGGQKYKVLGGEGTPAAYWYQPGMNDSPAGMAARTSTSASLPTYASNFSSVLTPPLQAPRVNPFGVS